MDVLANTLILPLILYMKCICLRYWHPFSTKSDKSIYLQNADFSLNSFLCPVFPSFLCLLTLQGLAFCPTFDEVECWKYFLWCQKESSFSKVWLLKTLQEQMEFYSKRINNIEDFPNVQEPSEKITCLELV